MTYRVGVDIGGTFIDFCVFDTETQALSTLKVLTTPAEPGAEVMQGMARLAADHGVEPAEIESFIHGTTIGVNTVIQRKGARMALFTTENFADVLEVARLRMPESYSLFSMRPEPLVTRDRVFGIAERMRADGSIQTPLDAASVKTAIVAAKELGAEGIIVSLLHGWRNPAHETAVAEIIRETAPELFVFTSNEIWPVIREYERTTTAVINGYIHPRVAKYLGSLQDALKESGVSAEPLVTKSNGGVMSAELGKSSCVNMVLSGTASGVMGGAHVARSCGVGNAITLDIGGTSADVAVVIDGRRNTVWARRSASSRSISPRSRSPRSATAAGRSRGSTNSASLRSAPRARARIRALPATGKAANKRRSPTPLRSRASSAITRSPTIRSPSMSSARASPSVLLPNNSAGALRKPPRRSSKSRFPACIWKSTS